MMRETSQEVNIKDGKETRVSSEHSAQHIGTG